MLLWALIGAIYLSAFSVWSLKRNPENAFLRYAIGWAALALLPITIFVLTISSPFKTLSQPYPSQGQGLNPVLQDIGLAIHPPTLYLGYVGLVIPWSLAVAALQTRVAPQDWARSALGWVYLPTAFLTAGIVLGSWWAYRELGWGGWWFWDPVENISLIPWLLAVALMHTLITVRSRQDMVTWSFSLAFLAFASTVLGTFLVRSGLLVSVHAFAADPARGLAILGYLTIIIGFPLILLLIKPPLTSKDSRSHLLSRDTAMWAQTVLVTAIAGTVLVGTLYPPIFQAAGLAPIAVGAPYYAATAVPLLVVAVFLMGLSPQTKWVRGHDKLWLIPAALAVLLCVAVVVGLTNEISIPALFAASVSAACLLAVVLQTIFLKGSLSRTLSHAGVAVFALAASLNVAYGVEGDTELRPGEASRVGPYSLALDAVSQVEGPNYVGAVGKVIVNNTLELTPEYRFYPVRQQPTTEADITTNAFRDLRASLNLVESSDQAETMRWAVRFHRQPAMIWLWIGALLTSVGLMISASNLLRSPS